ncbi:tetratricopeptide repeat protein [Streptomyces sp. NPDC017529]|uniref:tetratricopeptide repeat protein n=1 Tax=Streptomyces sp. NPDC017529 TaxID=3365000 RepID=UPI0037994BF3
MSDLRKELGEEAVPRINSGVCAIVIPEGSVDLFRFREGVRKAAHLQGPEEFDQLCDALAEWCDDEPLRGLPDGTFGTRKAELREERMDALRSQLEAAWWAGEEKWLRTETEKLFEHMPEQDWIFRFYLVTHGRELGHVARERLIKRWTKRHGSPAPDSDLQDVIDELRGTPRRARGTALRPVPDQLPACKHRPFGRDELMRDLEEVVQERQTAGRSALIVLRGLAGIGKSTVAYRLAALLRDRFPDGVLYANLQGFAGADVRPADPEHVLDRFLADLSPRTRATGVDGKSTALRSALARRSVLIMLDDAVNAAQVRPLLPGTGTSAVIVTSRKTLGELGAGHDAHFCTVGSLDDEAAAAILQERLRAPERGGHGKLISELVELCDRHPLALTVVARRLEHRSIQGISALVRDLRQERDKLDVLHLPEEEELSVRMALACSERALSGAARRLLWQLAVHPGPSICWNAVMDLGLAGEPIRADRAAEELVAASLVEFRSDRYSLHDLVRAFARHEVDPGVDGPRRGFEEATVRQVLEHQLQNVRACDRLLDRHRTLPVGDPDAVSVCEPEGLEQAMALLDSEYDTVQLGIQLAYQKGLERYTWLLPMALVTYQWCRHRLGEAQRSLELAREAAEAVAAPVDCAMVYRMLAGTHWRLGQFEMAAAQLRRAVLLSGQDNSESGRLSLARSLHTLALTLRKQGHGETAEEHHRQALELYRVLRDRSGEAAALNGLGTLHYDRGEYDEALRVCADALHLVETVDLRGKADVLYTLAEIHLSRSERAEALSLYRQASEIFRELEHWHDESKLLWLYADALVAAGCSREAVQALERVLVLRERMGGHGVREVRDRLEGLR